MNGEFFKALNMLEKEKGIPADYLIDKIKTAISIAVKKDFGTEDNVVEIDPLKGRFNVAIRKTVVENVEDKVNEILLSDASKYKRGAEIGSIVEIPLETKQFGRIAAQTAKHVIRQGIGDVEREQLLSKYEDKKYEIISAPVIKVDDEKGNVTLEIDSSEVILPKGEQIPGEVIEDNSRIMVYVSDVFAGTKGPKLMVSRTHPGFIKRLFEMETPEISDGVVEIKSVSREAGSRTKIAVFSREKDVDPVGACIGPKGSRVSSIVNELGGEKIDVIKYSEDPKEYIASALSPADVISVNILNMDLRQCQVTVPDNQLSLAIGNRGQNARLSARLTGWKIDIISNTSSIQQDEEINVEVEEEKVIPQETEQLIEEEISSEE